MFLLFSAGQSRAGAFEGVPIGRSGLPTVSTQAWCSAWQPNSPGVSVNKRGGNLECDNPGAQFRTLHRLAQRFLTSLSPPHRAARNTDAMVTNHFDAQASTNYKEAFSLFDTRGVGRVVLDKLGDLLRACGQNPTLAEIRDLEKSVGGEFDFETFQRILNRPGGFRDPGEPEEYCRGFQVFDKDMTGFIGVGQLKYILTNLGEKMSDDEVDELLKAVDTSSGQVNYTELVRTILSN